MVHILTEFELTCLVCVDSWHLASNADFALVRNAWRPGRCTLIKRSVRAAAGFRIASAKTCCLLRREILRCDRNPFCFQVKYYCRGSSRSRLLKTHPSFNLTATEPVRHSSQALRVRIPFVDHAATGPHATDSSSASHVVAYTLHNTCCHITYSKLNP